MLSPVPVPPTKRLALPGITELLLVWLLTEAIAIVANYLTAHALKPHPGLWPRYAAHTVMLVLPWLWYRLRLAPSLPVAERPLWRWPAGATRPLLAVAGGLGGFVFIETAWEASHSVAPSWMQAGMPTILAMLLFQGVFVGLSEEMSNRPALHLALRLRLAGAVRLGRLSLSHANLIASALFGLSHLGNLLGGQALGDTILQVLTAFVIGVITGHYYDRTRNYLGAAVIHNVWDGLDTLAVVLFIGH